MEREIIPGDFQLMADQSVDRPGPGSHLSSIGDVALSSPRGSVLPGGAGQGGRCHH